MNHLKDYTQETKTPESVATVIENGQLTNGGLERIGGASG